MPRVSRPRTRTLLLWHGLSPCPIECLAGQDQTNTGSGHYKRGT